MSPESTISVGPVRGRLLREAVGRVVGAGRASPEVISQFIETAPVLGVELDLLCATKGPAGGGEPRVRQACLPVPGAGGTLMLFLSPPGPEGSLGTPDEQTRERVLAIQAAIGLACDASRPPVALIQALAEPSEGWATRALELAGLQRIAELAYLSRDLRLGEARSPLGPDGAVAPIDGGSWPRGITVRCVTDPRAEDAGLHRGLERSYEATLDCPELAGMRSVRDIVASHRAVGEFDPTLWWVVEREGGAEGCVLVNRCPEQGCCELVYIGLSPRLRGLGLGRTLLGAAIAASAALERELRCAVDQRNEPARRMYARFGFVDRGRRIAMVARPDDLPNPSASGASG